MQRNVLVPSRPAIKGYQGPLHALVPENELHRHAFILDIPKHAQHTLPCPVGVDTGHLGVAQGLDVK